MLKSCNWPGVYNQVERTESGLLKQKGEGWEGSTCVKKALKGRAVQNDGLKFLVMSHVVTPSSLVCFSPF